MADDVAITAGSGTTIATDDCSGRHVQLIKLAYSGDVVATLVSADATGIHTRPYCTHGAIVSTRISDTSGGQVTIFAAAGASLKYYITSVALVNMSATNVYADIIDGIGGGIKLTVPLPAYGGAIMNLPVPIVGSANTVLGLDVSAATTTVYCTAVGYTAA